MLDATGPDVTVGPSILGLVTSGIYDDPLSVYREYIQNAVDELARLDGVEGKVEITIDSRRKKVSISDNGPGLTYQECLEDLIPISQSKKCFGRDRGFRGIGRLSALAFAESVTFLTRTSAQEPITRVAWSNPGLGSRANSKEEPELAWPNWVNIETLEGADCPDHFFRVEIDGVSLHSAGAMLNREAVRGYISEVCPVPFSSEFPFFEQVKGIFPPHEAPYSLRITLDDDEHPIQRQYGSAFALAGNKEGHFTEFEDVRVPSIDGRGNAAVGWIAHSSYLGAILKGSRIRGIRVRLGNIQVGNDRVFDHLFDEERFNRWCVGELHILDSRIVPNGRRDYFERNPHLRNLENHMAPIVGRITSRCRSASSTRNREKRFLSAVAEIEGMYELASSGYLSAEDGRDLVNRAITQVTRVREEIGSATAGKGHVRELDLVERKLNNLRVESREFPVRGLSTLEVAAYQKVFQAVLVATPSPLSAMKVIEAVFPGP